MSHANSDAQRWAQLVPATRPSNPSPASTGGAANTDSAESARPSGLARLMQNRAAEQARVLNGVSFEPGGAPYEHDWIPGITSKRADQMTAVAYGRSIHALRVENHNRTLIRTTLIVDIAPLAVNETKSEAVLTTLFGSDRAESDKEDHYKATYALATLGELRRRHLAGAWAIVCGEGHLDDAAEREGRQLKEAQDVFFPLVEKWNLARTATFVGAHGEAAALAIYHGNSIKSSPEKWPRSFYDSMDVFDAGRLAGVGAATTVVGGLKGVVCLLDDSGFSNKLAELEAVRFYDPGRPDVSLTFDEMLFVSAAGLFDLNHKGDGSNPGILDFMATHAGGTNQHRNRVKRLGVNLEEKCRLRSFSDNRRRSPASRPPRPRRRAPSQP